MKTIAASPVFGGRNGTAPYRVVLRLRGTDTWVTHKQFFYENGSSAFGSGNYFQPSKTQKEGEPTPFQMAYLDWCCRCQAATENDQLAPTWASLELGLIHEDGL